MIKNQYTDWTLEDISLEDIKNHKFIPNWVRAGYTSKYEAIDAVLKMMAGKEGLFSGMGLQPGQVVKRKKK